MRDFLTRRGLFTEIHRQEIGRACFEMARTRARYDLPGAATYLRERKEKGLIFAQGPAAPLSYRIAYTLLGFTAAERIARFAR